jgi:hypothetical protein
VDGSRPQTNIGLSTNEATDELERGAAVGRFILLGLLGRGGMGAVYAAYDPELDRRVAVKILQARSGDGEARLLREAKTVAKLQHPNVIVVYEVGRFRDSVFIAMEFVEGSTLGAWMRARPRGWRETLQLFQAAGRGLAAAHEIGIIHRDFKPENVMLTKAGEIRVMDFGLARQIEGGAEDLAPERPLLSPGSVAPSEVPAAPIPDQSIASIKLTRTGVMLGTPAYMAPEQFSGRAIDGRTDQFSFCVALYEALYGGRPFAGETVLSLGVNVVEGRVKPPPERSTVPGWLRRVLLRGLSSEPAARYESMKDLLEALGADPAARRRRWFITGAGTMLVAGLALGASRAGHRNGPVCGSGAEEFAGVWEAGSGTSPRKDAVKSAFYATGARFASQSYATAARLLDEYVDRWTSMHRQSCEATHVRGDQSEEVLDLRTACLADRLASVRALTDVFVKADYGVVVKAASAAGSLPPIDRCADVTALRAVVKPPDDPAVKSRVAELREELARVTAARNSGQCKLAEQRGAALIDAIRPTNYHPLLGEALSAVGELGYECAAADLSLARFKEGYLEATAGHDDGTAAFAASNVITMLVSRLGQSAGVRDWFLVARASAARLSSPVAGRGQLLTAEALVLRSEYDFEGEVAKLKEAATVTAKLLGPDHPLSLAALMNVGDALSTAGHYSEAVAAEETAFSHVRRVLGDEHPLAAMTRTNECEALNRSHRFEEALGNCERAMEIWNSIHPEPNIFSVTRTQLGIALVAVGKAGEAIRPLEEAVAGFVSAGARAAPVGEARFALARAFWSLPSERRRALAVAREARADYGADPKAVAEIDGWLAHPK